MILSIFKKSVLLIFFTLLISSSVFAVSCSDYKWKSHYKWDYKFWQNFDQEEINKECKDQFGEKYFGITKWEFKGSKGHGLLLIHLLEQYEKIHGKKFFKVPWKSQVKVYGIIMQEGDETKTFSISGKKSGSIKKSDGFKPTELTFCGKIKSSTNTIPRPKPHGAPEFTNVTLALVVLGGILGLSILRRE
jgi:hypothetical protein